MVRDRREVYAACAVVLPVTLGLGLIYLLIMGEIGLWAVVISLLSAAALVPFVAILAEAAETRWPGSRRPSRGPRRRRSVHAHRSANPRTES